MLLYVVPVGVAICAKFVQVAPWQRSTWYASTPTLSVDAVQARLMVLVPLAVAVRLEGVVGGDVSDAPVTVMKLDRVLVLLPPGPVTVNPTV